VVMFGGGVDATMRKFCEVDHPTLEMPPRIGEIYHRIDARPVLGKAPPYTTHSPHKRKNAYVKARRLNPPLNQPKPNRDP
jgi:hypothetical protein